VKPGQDFFIDSSKGYLVQQSGKWRDKHNKGYGTQLL
jgi:hypothetical protein